MKKMKYLSAFLCCVLLLPVGAIRAQDRQLAKFDDLKQAIGKLEAVKTESRSEATQMIHKRAIAGLYEKLQKALDDEIDALKEIQAALGNSSGDSGEEVAQRIKKLRDERKAVLDKIQKMAGDAQAISVSAEGGSDASGGGSETAESNTVSSPVTSAKPQSDGASNEVSSAAKELAKPAKKAKEGSNNLADTKPAVLCGQVSLTSLNKVIAHIHGLAKEADAKKLNGLEFNAKEMSDWYMNKNSPLRNSPLNNNCGDNIIDGKKVEQGGQYTTLITYLQQGLVLKSLLPDFKPPGSDGSVSRDLIEKQLGFLLEYLGNVSVELRGKDNKLCATRNVDRDGNYYFSSINLSGNCESPFTIATEGDDYYTKREFTLDQGETKRVNLEIEDRPVSLLARAVLGYQQAAAAATKFEQNYFFDLFVSKSLPLRQKINPDFGERVRTWFSVRAISVPQSGDVTIGDLSQNLATNISGLKAKDAVRVLDYLGGLEIRLGKGNLALLPSFDRHTRQKFSLSFILGGGFVTPTDPLSDIKIFKVFDDAPGLPPQAKGKEFVAFVVTDRDRFFRQYYAGFRVQTFFFNRYNMPMQRFPAQFDFTIGQNEYVTGGKLRGPVLRFDAYYPLPYGKLSFINLYSTLVVQPVGVKINTPLVLQEAPSDVKPPGANIALIPVSQFNRDYYKVGVGIDFVSFVQKLIAAGKK